MDIQDFLCTQPWLANLQKANMLALQRYYSFHSLLDDALCCFQLDKRVLAFQFSDEINKDVTQLPLQVLMCTPKSVSNAAHLPAMDVPALIIRICMHYYLVDHTAIVTISVPNRHTYASTLLTNATNASSLEPPSLFFMLSGLSMRLWCKTIVPGPNLAFSVNAEAHSGKGASALQQTQQHSSPILEACERLISVANIIGTSLQPKVFGTAMEVQAALHAHQPETCPTVHFSSNAPESLTRELDQVVQPAVTCSVSERDSSCTRPLPDAAPTDSTASGTHAKQSESAATRKSAEAMSDMEDSVILGHNERRLRNVLASWLSVAALADSVLTTQTTANVCSALLETRPPIPNTSALLMPFEQHEDAKLPIKSYAKKIQPHTMSVFRELSAILSSKMPDNVTYSEAEKLSMPKALAILTLDQAEGMENICSQSILSSKRKISDLLDQVYCPLKGNKRSGIGRVRVEATGAALQEELRIHAQSVEALTAMRALPRARAFYEN